MSTRCPICRQPASLERYRPLCSRRCAEVDLGWWLTGHYAIPSAPEEDDAEGVKDEEN